MDFANEPFEVWQSSLFICTIGFTFILHWGMRTWEINQRFVSGKEIAIVSIRLQGQSPIPPMQLVLRSKLLPGRPFFTKMYSSSISTTYRGFFRHMSFAPIHDRNMIDAKMTGKLSQACSTRTLFSRLSTQLIAVYLARLRDVAVAHNAYISTFDSHSGQPCFCSDCLYLNSRDILSPLHFTSHPLPSPRPL
jgi:hypothetical protein